VRGGREDERIGLLARGPIGREAATQNSLGRSPISANLLCCNIFEPAFSFFSELLLEQLIFASNGLGHGGWEGVVGRRAGADATRKQTHANDCRGDVDWSL
jgi:hypothetical protein